MGRVQAGYEKDTGRTQKGYGQGRGRTQAGMSRVCAGSRPQQAPPYPKIMKKKVSGRSKGKSILRSLLKIAAMVSGEAGGVLRGGQEVLRGRILPGLALLAVEDGEEAEHEGAAGSGEKATPVIPHGEVRRHHLDAEQHPWKNGGTRSGGLRGSSASGRIGEGPSPLMGAPKTVATPTACAATSISFCLNLSCGGGGVNQNPLFFERKWVKKNISSQQLPHLIFPHD